MQKQSPMLLCLKGRAQQFKVIHPYRHLYGGFMYNTLQHIGIYCFSSPVRLSTQIQLDLQRRMRRMERTTTLCLMNR